MKTIRCTICNRIIAKKINSSGEPYMIKISGYPESPPICSFCVEELWTAMEEKELNEYLKQQEIENSTSNISDSTSKAEKTCKNNNFERMEIAKKSIKGQDSSLKKLISIINHNINEKSGITKQNAMIIGKTGVGKTLIAKTIAEIFNLPYVIEDATCFTQVGYVGRNVTDMLYDLYLAANSDIKKAERGIVFIDEIDKKNKTSNSSPSESRVIESLLTMIQGSKIMVETNKNGLYDETIMIDTTNITFVVMGAFEELYEIRNKRINKKNIGFSVDDSQIKDDFNFLPEDFEKAGFNKQFIARFPNILELNDLNYENIKEIILNSNTSGMLPWIENFKSQNLELIYSDNLIDSIIKKVLNLEIGARAISKIVSSFMLEIEYNFLELEGENYKCYLDDDILNDVSKFRFEKV